ncbi:MAG: hypothetical protein RR585_05395 [Coprobacillus sp.]
MFSKEYLNGYQAAINEVQEILNENRELNNNKLKEIMEFIKTGFSNPIEFDFNKELDAINNRETMMLAITRIVSLLERKCSQLEDGSKVEDDGYFID